VTDVVLAVDQGTSSTRCFVVEADLKVLAVASRGVTSSFPRPGWVEEDPEQIAETVIETMREAVDRAGVGWNSVRGVGIDNQTETFAVWDRSTGEPVYPAIVWQDRRTAAECDRLRDEGHESLIRSRTGLELDPSFSATKLAWILDNVDGARHAAEAGRLAFGDVASWLVWRLSNGTSHVTEPSNASRSMLLDLLSLEWDPDLLALFGIPDSMLPEIRPSDSVLAETSEEVVGGRVPIAGVLGDQQAALFGQRCWEPGMAKVTLGTGAFLWANAGPKPPAAPDGILGTCAWQLRDEVAYAMEGFVPVAGAAVSWLVELGLLDRPEDSERIAAAAADSADVWVVPTFTGTGAPTWDPAARGAILGLTRGADRAHLVLATLDGVAHQIADAVEAMDHGVQPGLDRLRVDGGMARNDWLMQRLADLIARPVERPLDTEATGMGTAALAGLAAGLWSSRDELAEGWRLDKRFEPRIGDHERTRLREHWLEAVRVARGWG
jgi:glycerol kinase